MSYHSTRSGNSRMRQSPQKLSLARIMACIIIIVLIGGCSPSTATPIGKVDQFTYQVRVQAADTRASISGAKVIIDVTGKAPVDDITDTNGLARVFVPSSLAGQPAVLIVEATGYAPYRQNIDLLEGTLPDLVLLEAPSIITDTPTPAPEPTSTLTRGDLLATDTPAPAEESSLTPTDIPVPTDTLSPVPTEPPLATDTPSPAPTDAPLPTDTAPPVPTDTPTPTPTPGRLPAVPGVPSSTPTRTLTPAPSTGEFTLLKPTLEELTHGLTEFKWQWNGQLAENQGFEVRLWQDGEPPQGVHNAVLDNTNGTLKHLGNNTYSLEVDITDTPPVRRRSGEYKWTVLLVQVKPEFKELGIQAPPSRLRFELDGNGDGNRKPTPPDQG
jgi:hypothetical protein